LKLKISITTGLSAVDYLYIDRFSVIEGHLADFRTLRKTLIAPQLDMCGTEFFWSRSRSRSSPGSFFFSSPVRSHCESGMFLVPVPVPVVFSSGPGPGPGPFSFFLVVPVPGAFFLESDDDEDIF